MLKRQEGVQSIIYTSTREDPTPSTQQCLIDSYIVKLIKVNYDKAGRAKISNRLFFFFFFERALKRAVSTMVSSFKIVVFSFAIVGITLGAQLVVDLVYTGLGCSSKTLCSATFISHRDPDSVDLNLVRNINNN